MFLDYFIFFLLHWECTGKIWCLFYCLIGVSIPSSCWVPNSCSQKATLPSISSMGIVGAGQMGAGIAQVAASVGKLDVLLMDSSQESITKSMNHMRTFWMCPYLGRINHNLFVCRRYFAKECSKGQNDRTGGDWNFRTHQNNHRLQGLRKCRLCCRGLGIMLFR